MPQATGPGSAAPTGAWPQTVQDGNRAYRVFQPQFEQLDGTNLLLSAAVEMRSPQGSVQRGIATMKAQAVAADVPGEIEVQSITVTDLRFGETSDSFAAATLSKNVAGLAFTVDRSTLVEDMALVNSRGSSTPGLSFAPPKFARATVPSVLVTIDGAPILVAAGSGGWMSVRNTPFTVLVGADGSWWVQVGATAWLTAPSQSGPFAPAASTPPADAIAGLGTPPDTSKTLGLQGSSSGSASTQKTPTSAVVVTQPTVLIATDGEPALSPAGDGLSEVTNANTILLQSTDAASGSTAWWTVAAGRWFSSASLDGPWSFVAPSALPASFQSIPAGGRMTPIRAAVPGTTESKDAVVAAREVRTVVMRADASCPVTFRGEPNFVPVDGAQGLVSATDASDPVVGVAANDGTTSYFCCSNGAWFTAAAPSGPWSVTDALPSAIDSIPPSSPIYPVTYVEVFGSTRDPQSGALQTVTFGFSAGYLGTFVHEGTPVYGTGYDYSAGQDAAASTADSYQASPETYAAPVSYDPQTGTYAPPAYDDGYPYATPWVQPYYLENGWDGWGWCGGWSAGWGWGWNTAGMWNNWGSCWNHWHPYWNPNWQNQWQQDHQRYENARGANAVARQPANSPWGESSDWQKWNSASAAGNEPQNHESADWQKWNSASAAGNEPQNQESADWQKWNSASAAGNEPQNQRPANQPASYSRNTGYGWNSSGAPSPYTNQRPGYTNPSASNAWNAAPRTGTSGFHPAYRSNYATTGASAPAYRGGERGGRR